MTYQNFPIDIGVYSRSSVRSGAGRWISANNYRFFGGFPETIGGSQRLYSTALSGKCRKVLYFASNAGGQYIMLATSKKLYAWNNSEVYNLTPYRDTGTLGTDPFNVTFNEATVIVTDTAHGLAAGDTVSYSGATAGGGITISGEYIVTSVTDANTYVITHTSAATSTDTTTGGAAVAYKYEITIGADDASVGTGWGAGVWRAGGTFSDNRAWNEPEPSGTGTTIQPRLVSMDNYGEDVVACLRDGKTYYFDTSLGVNESNRFTELTNAPQTSKYILVDPNGGQNIIAFGAYDNIAAADNPMLVRWCETGNPTVWTESLISDAGRYQLTAGSQIMCAVPVDKQILILTDTSAYLMSPEEYPYSYSFRLIATACGADSPNALVTDETGRAMWRSQNKFFMFDGNVQEITCDIHDEAFNDVNSLQKYKIHAGLNTSYNEVWFYHASSNSTEINKAIVYDYMQKIWYPSDMARTAYIDSTPLHSSPFAVTTDNYIQLQDIGTSDNNVAINKNIKCVVEIADGNDLMFINRLIPDFDYFNGNATVTATCFKEPQSTGFTKSKVISSNDTQVSLRARGRHVEIEFSSTGQSDSLRLGKIRLDVVTHGER